ncbi:hypothetical protein [Sphingomonas sp. Leaf242]|nr:hypothetical protein [Sphingomonas sp. Leaf242]
MPEKFEMVSYRPSHIRSAVRRLNAVIAAAAGTPGRARSTINPKRVY